MTPRFMYVVQIKLPAGEEDVWNKWHNEEHIPKVLAQPGFLSVRKFRCLTNRAKEVEYFVLYELRNQSAYDKYVKSDEGASLRQHYLDEYGAKTKITRYAWQETFRQDK